MRLNQLIKHLEKCQQDTGVVFDFGGLVPTKVDSSRGSYEDLALGFGITEYQGGNAKKITVAELLVVLRAAIGETYQGYKGGDFTMNEHTHVCVDNWGEWTNTQITGVRDRGYKVIIETVCLDGVVK